MRADGLTVELRLRTPWEATDLGVALTRAHAGRIWGAWFLVTLPVLALLHLLLWPTGQLWIAGLLMWWLKPVFDRIPLYVLSRAVLGTAPGIRETVRQQARWGWRGIWPWLLWLRLHPSRSLLLPVDLLEQLRGRRRSERVRVLARGDGAPHVLLTILGVHLELMLSLSIVAFALMLVPVEFMSDSFKEAWETLLDDMPAWLVVASNVVYWLGVSIMEPFYVGAGFGLYLSRRTQLEAWDIELAFRRIAARLAAPLLFAAVAVGTLLHGAAPASAQDVEAESKASAAKDADDGEVRSIKAVFRSDYRDDGAPFAEAVDEAFESDELSPKSTVTRWQRRDALEDAPDADSNPAWLKAIGVVLSLIIEYALWILVAIAVILLIVHHKRWMPWISERFDPARAPDPLALRDVPPEEAPLPDDVPGAVRALWAQGYSRAALSLLYRAAVARLVDTVGIALPPGATEADCVRHARRLREHPFAGAFVAIVRCWQSAAYAARLPDGAELERLLGEWERTREQPA